MVAMALLGGKGTLWGPVLGAIVLQLWHMGRLVHPDFLGGQPPVSASATTAPDHAHTPTGRKPYEQARALSVDENARVVGDYRRAAENAKKAGGSAECLVGNEGVSTGSSRWSPYD